MDVSFSHSQKSAKNIGRGDKMSKWSKVYLAFMIMWAAFFGGLLATDNSTGGILAFVSFVIFAIAFVVEEDRE